MEGWSVLLALAPVALAMHWIRRREASEGATRAEDLTPAQKGWLLLLALNPGAAGRVVACMDPQEWQAYARAGGELKGRGQQLLPGLLRELRAWLPPEWRPPAGQDPEEALEGLSRFAEVREAEWVALLRERYPPPGGWGGARLPPEETMEGRS